VCGAPPTSAVLRRLSVLGRRERKAADLSRTRSLERSINGRERRTRGRHVVQDKDVETLHCRIGGWSWSFAGVVLRPGYTCRLPLARRLYDCTRPNVQVHRVRDGMIIRKNCNVGRPRSRILAATIEACGCGEPRNSTSCTRRGRMEQSVGVRPWPPLRRKTRLGVITHTPEVSVLDDLPARGVVDAAYEVFREARIPPSTLYIPVRDMTDEAAIYPSLETELPSPLRRLLVDYCKRLQHHAQALLFPEFDGFEVWTNASEPGNSRVLLHIDNDEEHRRSTGELRSPIMGSILYLGPDELRKGGGTMFCLDEESRTRYEDLLFRPTRWNILQERLAERVLLVPFRRGRIVLFKGHLPHCVAPFDAARVDRPRISLLVNGWNRRIAMTTTSTKGA
jgi:hypothetical protein